VARTAVPVTRVSRLQVNGVPQGDEVAGDTVNGMSMVNNGATLLHLDNLPGVAQTISLILVGTVDFQPAGPAVLTVAADTYAALVGPFPIDTYGNVLEFDVSSASLNFAAFSLI